MFVNKVDLLSVLMTRGGTGLWSRGGNDIAATYGGGEAAGDERL